MNVRNLVMLAAVIAGLASGPSSLESAAASVPPITWSGLAFLSLGSLIGLPLLLGFQVALRNAEALRWGWKFFLLGAPYFVTSGVAAVAVAAVGHGLAPHAFLFAVFGLSLLAALGIVRIVFASKFTDAI